MGKGKTCSIISGIISLLLLILLIVMIVLGFNQRSYYMENYNQTYMHVIGYRVLNETCYDSDYFNPNNVHGFNGFNEQNDNNEKEKDLTVKKLPFSAYVLLEYNVTVGATSIIYHGNISKFCGNTYENALNEAKSYYPSCVKFRAWYFITCPSDWIRYLPKGEMYMLGCVIISLIFISSLLFLIVYSLRKKCFRGKNRKNNDTFVSKNDHVNANEIDIDVDIDVDNDIYINNKSTCIYDDNECLENVRENII